MCDDNTQSEKDMLMIKGALSGLRQFLATESPLKIMRNAFHFTIKALFCSQYNLVKPELNKQKEHIAITILVRLSSFTHLFYLFINFIY